MKVKGFVLYKIYYDDTLIYIGRTKQPLRERIRGHVFSMPHQRRIDINLISKIEYALFDTEADMNVYEVYLINKFKPCLNVDDKARDELTITLPDKDFEPYTCKLWDKWRVEINNNTSEFFMRADRRRQIPEEKTLLRDQLHMGKISRDEYEDKLELLINEDRKLKEYLSPRRKKRPPTESEDD